MTDADTVRSILENRDSAVRILIGALQSAHDDIDYIINNENELNVSETVWSKLTCVQKDIRAAITFVEREPEHD